MDTILVSGSSTNIRDLSERIQEFVESPDRKLNVNTLAHVSSLHPVTLWLAKSAGDAKGLDGFVWVCGKDQIEVIREKLQPLIDSTSGHQYFDDFGDEVQLLVSVGEYDERWWTSQA